MGDALALLEIASVPGGLRALDALTKYAEVRIRGTGTIEPGRYLIVFDGALDEVEEAHRVACERGGSELVDQLLLSFAHPEIAPALAGARALVSTPDCIGVVSGPTICGVVGACERSLKNASVKLVRLRVAGGLGGQATFVVAGSQPDVEEALALAEGELGVQGRVEVIPRPSPDVLAAVVRDGAFGVS